MDELSELRSGISDALYIVSIHLFSASIITVLLKTKKPPSPQLTMSAKTAILSARSGARTLDTLIKSQVLYQLS